jgi:hypothetical protein
MNYSGWKGKNKMKKPYENKEEVYNELGKKDGDRFIKLLSSETSEDQKTELFQKILANDLARKRRHLRSLVKALDNYILARKQMYKGLVRVTANTFTGNYNYVVNLVKSLNEYDSLIEAYYDLLGSEGKFLMHTIFLYNLEATDHEFCQIINANIRLVQKYREDYDNREHSKSDSFFIDLIQRYNIEQSDDCVFLRAILQSEIYKRRTINSNMALSKPKVHEENDTSSEEKSTCSVLG